MRTTALLTALLISTASAFQTPLSNKARIEATQLKDSLEDTAECSSGSGRRSFFKAGAAAVASASLSLLQPDFAYAGLLDEYGADPTKIKDSVAEKKEIASSTGSLKKAESNLEPNLRSNYYYPTNKKRYLPRIKKCNDAIPGTASMIGAEDWGGVEEFATKIADDTILPMKLYTSSLLGGGTNVKVSFAKDMNQATKDFEVAQKKLLKAIGKKDQQKSSQALEDLATALLAYRTAGRLLGPDGGGDIPSVDDIRRSASRTQKGFEAGIKKRDERLKENQ